MGFSLSWMHQNMEYLKPTFSVFARVCFSTLLVPLWNREQNSLWTVGTHSTFCCISLYFPELQVSSKVSKTQHRQLSPVQALSHEDYYRCTAGFSLPLLRREWFSPAGSLSLSTAHQDTSVVSNRRQVAHLISGLDSCEKRVSIWLPGYRFTSFPLEQRVFPLL